MNSVYAIVSKSDLHDHRSQKHLVSEPSSDGEEWNRSDTKMLLQLTEGKQEFDWEYIASHLSKKHSPKQCMEWFRFLNEIIEKRLDDEVERRESYSNSLSEKKKRIRRKAAHIARTFKCIAPDCQKAYGSESALKHHFKTKHPDMKYQKSSPVPRRFSGGQSHSSEICPSGTPDPSNLHQRRFSGGHCRSPDSGTRAIPMEPNLLQRRFSSGHCRSPDLEARAIPMEPSNLHQRRFSSGHCRSPDPGTCALGIQEPSPGLLPWARSLDLPLPTPSNWLVQSPMELSTSSNSSVSTPTNKRHFYSQNRSPSDSSPNSGEPSHKRRAILERESECGGGGVGAVSGLICENEVQPVGKSSPSTQRDDKDYDHISLPWHNQQKE